MQNQIVKTTGTTLLTVLLLTAGCAAPAQPAEDTLFTERDLKQEADLANAVYYTVSDGSDLSITEEGVYVLSGEAEEVTITVDAAEDAKVQIVLDNVSIHNSASPVLTVNTADKVFLTTTADSRNEFRYEGTGNAVESACDLTMNGSGSLSITSSGNGVKAKDTLVITGGTYTVNAAECAFEANDSIAVCDAVFDINAGTDGFHAENSDDDLLGFIVFRSGTVSIKAGDDAIHGQSSVTVSDGSFEISAAEGIETSSLSITGGELHITAEDDGLNAGHKSDSVPVSISISGGTITIDAVSAETDGIDSNGDITISGGTVTVNAESAFDYDGTGTIIGGTVIINGEPVTELNL